MITNQLKAVKALLVSYDNGTKVDLPAASIPKLMNIYAPNQILNLAGAGLQSFVEDAGSIRYFKNVFATVREITPQNVSQGYIIENAKVSDVTVELNINKYTAESIRGEDRLRGLGFIAATKLDSAMNILLRGREVDGFNLLKGEDSRKASNTLSAADRRDGHKIHDWLMNAANTLTEVYDSKQGINKIPADKIIIYAKPEILTAINKVRLLGDSVKVAFSTGIFTINTLGGYNIVKAMNLPSDVGAIVTTDVSLKAPWRLVEAGINPATTYAKADLISFCRILRGQAIIYSNLTKVLYI